MPASIANSCSRMTLQCVAATAKSENSTNLEKSKKANAANAVNAANAANVDAKFDARWEHFLKYCDTFFVGGDNISSPCTIQMSKNMMRFMRKLLGDRSFFHKHHLAVFVVIFQVIHKFVDGYDSDYELTYPHWFYILEREVVALPTLKFIDTKVYEQKTFCKLCKRIEVLFIDTVKWDIGQFFDTNWYGSGETDQTDLAIAASRLTLGYTRSKGRTDSRVLCKSPRAPCSTPCNQVSIPNALNATIREAAESKFKPVASEADTVDTAPATPDSPEISCGNLKRKRSFNGVESVERTAFVTKIS